MMSEIDFTNDQIVNPYRNVYWFARMLINNDKYGGFGKDSKILAEISSHLRGILENPDLSNEERLTVSKNSIKNILIDRYSRASATIARVKQFTEDVNLMLLTISDVKVLILTIEMVMIPINNSLLGIPNNDREYTLSTARAYLDSLGEKGLATVIGVWDDMGVNGCLTAERVAIVRDFSTIRKYVENNVSGNEQDIILTSFVQEYERRLGQKRKARAGGSLEDVASFIFNYYQINTTDRPEHFQADIEVDKWIRCKDRWLIGISCKRTLRERWKQVSSANRDILSKFMIKNLWHLVTYDEDLSDEKLTLLGSLGHIFYLRDDSRKLINAQSHVGMQNYVRPMSDFVNDIKREQS